MIILFLSALSTPKFNIFIRFYPYISFIHLIREIAVFASLNDIC